MILVSLAIVAPAHAFTFVPPPLQSFDGRGITYAVDYACGEATGVEYFGVYGEYHTAIVIHNKQSTSTFIYIKILDAYNNLSLWAKNPTTTEYRFPIQPDGLLYIDCKEIATAEGFGSSFPCCVFLYGLIVISQPSATTALDIIGTYQTLDSALSSSPLGTNLVIYPGTSVLNVPVPCVPTFSNTCQTLPP